VMRKHSCQQLGMKIHLGSKVLVILFFLIILSCRIPSRNGLRNACMQNLRGWSFLALRMNESCVLIITFIK
jgi:hypothetical protein